MKSKTYRLIMLTLSFEKFENMETWSVVRTVVYLRKVTCPFRVNFKFLIELVQVSYEKPFFTWWQFFTA